MPTPPSLKARALQWLAQREHSRSELQRKLITHASASSRASAGGRPVREDRDAAHDVGEVPESAADVERAVEAVLDWLEAHGHLSEARFVESRLHVRAPRFGHRRIAAELARHGVEIDADRAAALRTSEFERARAVWQRKFGQAAADVAGRMRQMRFLGGRGFDADVIRRVVPPASRAPEDEADTPSGD
jgi:regulatory protein